MPRKTIVEIDDTTCIGYRKDGMEIKAIRVVSPFLCRPAWIPYISISDDSEVYLPGHHGRLKLAGKSTELDKFI